MKKISDKIQIAIFLAFIGVFFIINILTPNKEFSPQENRMLTLPPYFSFDSLFKGSFTADYEKYITDQFAARDIWISLKSISERAMGKTENNNVFFCKNDTLIERFSAPDMSVVSMNIDAVNELAENAGIPVYLALIPGAVKIWEDRLPYKAVNYDQEQLINDVYSKVSCPVVDVLSELKAHKDEYIFYRTDHHWTSLGAYYGYCAVMREMDITPLPLDSYSLMSVSDSFFGTTYSSSGVRWISPDEIDLYVPDDDIQVFKYEAGKETAGELYDYSAIDKKDKYAFFLGGNTALLKAVTSDLNAPKLLILRDSYTDCELPFLLEHFSEIHLIDLRYYKFSILEYIKNNNIDTVLINYSISNFSSDTNIFLLGK